MRKSILLIGFICCFGLKGMAGVSISQFAIQSQYLNTEGKLTKYTNTAKIFAVDVTLIKAGIEYNTVGVTVMHVAPNNGTKTELSTEQWQYDGDWGSNVIWQPQISATLPANIATGKIYLRIRLFQGSSPGATISSVTEYEIYVLTFSEPDPPTPPPFRYNPFSSLGYTRVPWYNISASGVVWSTSNTIPMLTSGQAVYTPNGQYMLLLQSDGNLVIYRTSNSQALWASNSNGKGGINLYFQEDGNLVLYKNNGGVAWSSGIYKIGEPNTIYAKFVLQDDGNLVMVFDRLIDVDILGETQTNNRVSSHWGTF